MDKVTGFMRYAREGLPKRPPSERVRDWAPIQLLMPDEKLQQQAARCMDCGIPFCHEGRELNGATSGCPINNLIPEWNDLIYRGLWQDAYQRLARTNNFPEFTGLTCPAPCEAACTLGISDPAVTIKNIEYAIIDRAFNQGWVAPNVPSVRSGKKVAVVGSGPAGLACADQLNVAGHAVTVFERDDRIGGLLMYGIPNPKLDKSIVQRRVDLLADAGITFKTGVEIGKDVTVAELQAEYDAIVLCTGATVPRALRGTDNSSVDGIHYAMSFLHANTQSLLDSELADGNFISAADKDVIVIGGGDTGTDCIATALRHGCRSLTQFDYHVKPPASRPMDNPWPEWPRIYTQDYGHKEAEALFGTDPRGFQLLTKRFIDDGNGHVTAVETVDIEWLPEPVDGQRFREVPNSERQWPTQLVLIAIGYSGPEASLPQQLGIAIDGRGNIDAVHGEYVTSQPGVFAAGDARRGQSLVVWAIQEGRGAARACDLYLMGETDLPF